MPDDNITPSLYALITAPQCYGYWVISQPYPGRDVTFDSLATMTATRSFRCTACKEVHTWTAEEATIEILKLRAFPHCRLTAPRDELLRRVAS